MPLSACAESAISESEVPAQEYRADGKARPDRAQQDEVSLLQPLLPPRVGKREGDRPGGRVAVHLEVDDDLVEPEPQALRGGFDDPAVRLVRDEQIDLRR